MNKFAKQYKDKGGKSLIMSLRYNKDMVTELIELTNFLPKDTNNSERLYYAIHEITEIVLCEYCGKPRKFHKLNRGFHGTCNSKECKLKHRSKVNIESAKKVDKELSKQRQEATMLKNFGAKHNWCKGTTSRDTYHQTMKERYGSEFPLANKKIHDKQQKTIINKFGTNNWYQFPKSLQTMLFNFPDALNEETGVINIMTSKKGHELWEDTIIKKYGVSNPMQVKEIFEKQQKSGFMLKEYNDTGLWYRGSYEFDFLNNFHNTIDIEDPLIVPEYDGSKYFPDFYIPSRNLIVEIKSSYYFKRDRETIIKKALATLKLGYEFMIIIDKDYSYFRKYCNL